MTTPHVLKDPEAQTNTPKRGVPSNAIDSRNDDEEAHSHEEGKATEYGDSSATYWELYASEAKINDQKFVDTLISDTKALSLLNGIFSSIIASFIQQTSQALQPDNSQETVCLLSQLVSQSNSTQPSSRFCPGPYSGGPSAAVIRSNILLIISFFLAMAGVVACGLTHQWCDEFMKFAYPRASPHKRGRVRTYMFQGLNQFHMRNIMYGVRVVLVVSVVFFFCGFSDYLYSLYPTVGWFSWSCVIAAAIVYGALTIFPLIIGNCPYQTALTTPLRSCRTLLLFSGHTVWRWFRPSKEGALSWHEVSNFDKVHFLVNEANEKAASVDPCAMEWLFTENDFSDTDMDKFLEGLPGYVHSHITVKEALPKALTAPYILRRIREHLLTCVTATEPSEEARVKRVSACVESLRVILHLQTNAEGLKNADEEESLREYMQSIVHDLNTLCGKPEEKRDLRAFCVRALAFQGFLTKCLEPSLEPASEGSPDVKVPSHFIPLSTFFSSQYLNHTSQTQLQDNMLPHAAVSVEKVPASEDKTRRVLLHDGPLINLTLLAKAILAHGEAVDSSILSMCWKTLDMLRREFRVNRAEVSDTSLALFDDVHKKTRSRVEVEEPGFSIIPLLEVMDAVDGGRRLCMVFQTDHKYHLKADLVFGKDHLRNPDLFRAFAHCLPHFVTNYPEKSIGFMEGLVHYDHLWSSLQVHLSTSFRPNGFNPAMLHVIDTYCTVIDSAFVALEHSNVDWRAPDFGSLAHSFELFVTACFRGMFIERVTGFRVGLIKARFCRAVLAQFLDEFDHEGTVVFRSHWDVASLAKVFYSLGVGEDADVEFWKSFVDVGRGPIGSEFMAKTHTMLHTAERDGPLLNFCKLGQLGTMAVPFKGSGLEDTDFKKLLDLMQMMTEDPRLPLTRASTSIWEDLSRLRDEVVDICARSLKEDEANMQALLVKIDEVYRHRPTSAQESRPSHHVRVQASGTSAVMQPNPLPGGPNPRHDRSSSYASTSTAVIEDRPISSPVEEVEIRGITHAPSNNSRGEFANVYRTPYPFITSPIGPSGSTTPPFSASFSPPVTPLLGSTDVVSPRVPSTPAVLHMRSHSRHRHASVYYPPRGNTRATWPSRSAMSSPLPLPTRAFSFPSSSNTWLGSAGDAAFSSNPPHSR